MGNFNFNKVLSYEAQVIKKGFEVTQKTFYPEPHDYRGIVSRFEFNNELIGGAVDWTSLGFVEFYSVSYQTGEFVINKMFFDDEVEAANEFIDYFFNEILNFDKYA